MREQQLQSKIIKELEKQGAWVVKVISANKRGTPDLLVCLKGKFYAIEVKAPGKLSTVSEIQKYQLNKIIEAGGVAIISDNSVHALTQCV
tara:strand:- start:67 stop:336 length:270 start_codon:yes stop_codon:yes gene_type:complete